MARPDHSKPLIIENVHLPPASPGDKSSGSTYTVRCEKGKIVEISQFHSAEQNQAFEYVDGKGGILLPSMCHSHIHLDKCNLLSQCSELKSGSFQEAMEVTAKVKESYTSDDLLVRGRHLILESVKYGVTAMRAHVEVDNIVMLKCLEAGIQLKEETKHLCDVEIAIFAQEPLYLSSLSPIPSSHLAFLVTAASYLSVSAVGSAPYVEPSHDHALKNIDHIFKIALTHNLHIDFHLDYNISPESKVLTHYVIEQAHVLAWKTRMVGKRITIGHAPRLGLLSHPEITELRERIGDLPISIVGLPQTDMYMLGRDDPKKPRGTLNVPEWKGKFEFPDIAMAVNNVGNPFTPQGSLDPLSLCTFGVAVFQTGLPVDCYNLLDAVTNASKRAVGICAHDRSLALSPGGPADLVIVHGNDTVQSVVLNPGFERTVIKGGRVIASKRATEFVASLPDT
ncbi:hypothetical protein BU17DRAFT_40552 [Hysterangium stoloniferum]|nr:hypothetical protein BU17DRAFT_40552 [Hysterangium stoloniferum]